MKQSLVVIGNGMAGVRAVEEILERGGGDQFDITVFGDEPYGNYNRILLSHVLSGAEDETGIFLNPLSWYEENAITLRAGVRVVKIDRLAKAVFGDDGTVQRYDKLVIATGSRAFVPPMEGLFREDHSMLPGAFGFRTIDDTRSMVAMAREHEKAVVVGGGLLGLEAARGLQTHGVQVELLQAAPYLMNQQLDAEGGAILRQSVEKLGIVVHVDARATAVIGDDRVRGVHLADGRFIGCDLLVLAAGVRPNSGLALTAGLTVGRAIVVDDQMRTVDDDIYAVGECCQHRDQVYGLVAPLWDQARVLADHITGTDPTSAYHGSRIATKLKVGGVDVASMGIIRPEREDDEFIVFSEPKRGVYKSIIIRDDRLVGATLLGDVSKTAFLMQAFDRGLPLPEERVRLMFDLGGPPASVGVEELADDAQVCNCSGVSKGALVQSVRDGAVTVPAVMNQTRAGKGCGSCTTLVEQIVEWAAGDAMEVDPAESYYAARVAPSRSGRSRSPSSVCAAAPCARWRPCARTPAAPWPTGRSTTWCSSVPCT
jgi:NAD(P)H-dependent nitrite reductase large subunit